MKKFFFLTLPVLTLSCLSMTSTIQAETHSTTSATSNKSQTINTQDKTYPVFFQDGGRRGRRGNADERTFTPEQIEQFKKRMQERLAQREKENTDRLKKSLNAPADEFSLIKSKIDALQNLKRQAQPIRSNRRGGAGGQDFRQMFEGMAKGDQSYAKKIKAASETLGKTMKNKSASETQIENNLSALRKARKSLTQAIEIAKEDLESILTVKQEAKLVLLNILD